MGHILDHSFRASSFLPKSRFNPAISSAVGRDSRHVCTTMSRPALSLLDWWCPPALPTRFAGSMRNDQGQDRKRHVGMLRIASSLDWSVT